MTEEPENLVLEQLRAIRKDIAEMREGTGTRIETLAGSMVSMRNDIDGVEMRLTAIERILMALRGDVRTIAIAIDGHAHRLERIEERLGLTSSSEH